MRDKQTNHHHGKRWMTMPWMRMKSDICARCLILTLASLLFSTIGIIQQSPRLLLIVVDTHYVSLAISSGPLHVERQEQIVKYVCGSIQWGTKRCTYSCQERLACPDKRHIHLPGRLITGTTDATCTTNRYLVEDHE